MNNSLHQFCQKIHRPTDAHSLAVFRFLFGLLMYYQSFIIFTPEYIQTNLVFPPYHFHFSLFNLFSLPELSEKQFYWLFQILNKAALAIALGFLYRLASITFFLSFLYIFLFEKGMYSDYSYLVLLISFLFTFVDANKCLSLDRLLFKKTGSSKIEYGQLLIFRIQILIVYFFAGLAKINPDWLLRAEPVRTWLSENILLYGNAMSEPWFAYTFAWMTCILNFISFVMLTQKSLDLWGFLFIVLGQAINYWFFGTEYVFFSLLMISSCILFAQPDGKFINQLKNYFSTTFQSSSSENEMPPKSNFDRKIFEYFVIGFIIIQILIPLRHWIYPGPAAWTKEGYRFSWRMKIDDYKYTEEIRVFELSTQKLFTYIPAGFSDNQLTLHHTPDMLVDYIHYLKKRLKDSSISPVEITVFDEVSWNGRPYQKLVYETLDFTKINYPDLRPAKWIYPANE